MIQCIGNSFALDAHNSQTMAFSRHFTASSSPHQTAAILSRGTVRHEHVELAVGVRPVPSNPRLPPQCTLFLSCFLSGVFFLLCL